MRRGAAAGFLDQPGGGDFDLRNRHLTGKGFSQAGVRLGSARRKHAQSVLEYHVIG